MKVLLTGATGFIGRHVTSTLHAQGIEFVTAGRTPAAYGGFIEADLLEPGAPQRVVAAISPSHLLHLAWNAIPGRFWTDPNNLRWCAASLELVHAFYEIGGERSVLVGTCAEYDWRTDAVLDEHRTPIVPATFYGAAKDALHRAVAAYARQHGKSHAWGRIFWLYGPGEPLGRLVSDIAAALSRGEPVGTSSGLQCRDFLHVEDVAGALVTALHSSHRGAFNVGSGTAVPVRQVAASLGAMFGRPELVRIGERAGGNDEAPALAAAIDVLRRSVGFEPRFTLETGLADTVTWWRDRA